ncbi:MAG: hypothetical protein ACPGO5_04655 [Patescibacteria group bacterium]
MVKRLLTASLAVLLMVSSIGLSATHTAEAARSKNKTEFAQKEKKGRVGIKAPQQVITPTHIAGEEDVVIGVFGLRVSKHEHISLDVITVLLDEDQAASINGLYLVDDQGNQLGSMRPQPGEENLFFVFSVLPKNTRMGIAVMADIASDATAESIAPSLYVNATGGRSHAQILSNTAEAQGIHVVHASELSATLSQTSPASDIILANTTNQHMTTISFNAVDEDIEIQDITLTTDAAFANSVSMVNLEYPIQNGTGTAVGYLSNNKITFTNLGMYVPKNSASDLRISIDVNSIASGADTGDEGSIDFDVTGQYKHIGLSSGIAVTDATKVAAGNIEGSDMIVRKTMPYVTSVSLPTQTLTNGTNKVISKFMVSADAAGSVSFYQVTWDVLTVGDVEISDPVLYDTAANLPVAASSTIHSGGYRITTIMDPMEDMEIGAGSSKTFELKATITGSDGGDVVITNLVPNFTWDTLTGTAAEIAAVDTGLVWSDMSAQSHSLESTDWTNTKYVDGLPTEQQVLFN